MTASSSVISYEQWVEQFSKSENSLGELHLFFFSFDKQSVYKQLALGWQIAKQLSWLNPLSLSNNKNILKESGVFPLQQTIAAKTTLYQNSHLGPTQQTPVYS